MAVELGVDAGGEAVAHDQQRRVGQRQAVGQQLLERGVQIAARSLVFPGEVVALEHIGIAACLAQHQGVLLEDVVAVAARRGHAQQLAQVHEVGLRALAFVEVISGAAGAPFGDELLRGHAWSGCQWPCRAKSRASQTAVASACKLATGRRRSPGS